MYSARWFRLILVRLPRGGGDLPDWNCSHESRPWGSEPSFRAFLRQSTLYLNPDRRYVSFPKAFSVLTKNLCGKDSSRYHGKLIYRQRFLEISPYEVTAQAPDGRFCRLFRIWFSERYPLYGYFVQFFLDRLH